MTTNYEIGNNYSCTTHSTNLDRCIWLKRVFQKTTSAISVVADEIINNHLGIYKKPYSPRRRQWLQKLCVDAKLAE